MCPESLWAVEGPEDVRPGCRAPREAEEAVPLTVTLPVFVEES